MNYEGLCLSMCWCAALEVVGSCSGVVQWGRASAERRRRVLQGAPDAGHDAPQSAGDARHVDGPHAPGHGWRRETPLPGPRGTFYYVYMVNWLPFVELAVYYFESPLHVQWMVWLYDHNQRAVNC